MKVIEFYDMFLYAYLIFWTVHNNVLVEKCYLASSEVEIVKTALQSQPFPSVAFRGCYAKFETSSSYINKIGFGEPLTHTSDRSGFLNTRSFRVHSGQSSFIRIHSFSSQAGTKTSGEENDDVKDDYKELDHESDNEVTSKADSSESDSSETENDLELSDAEEDALGSNSEVTRASPGLFKVIANSSSMASAKKALDKWAEEGHDMSRPEVAFAMSELRKRRMYGKALQLSEWLESQENVQMSERDYASRIDLIAKIRGVQKAESYIGNIPKSFRGEIIYRTLLANCVLNTDTKKAEQIFNKMKDLNLPVTSFACNQLLLLYKRTDKKKIADVLLLMEKENIKPTLFTYRLLIETKGHSNDIIGMEQVLETMKSEGLKPDLRLQLALARQYFFGGLKEKTKEILKEVEGGNLNENRRVCSSLLPIYALLGSVDDVKRVWEVCQSNPRTEECMNAIDAFGRLKKVDEAEAVFNDMSKKWQRLSAKQYTSMLNVYASNKMLSKGKELVKQMSESGCRIGPLTWDALVKLYLESGEIEKADLMLNNAAQQNKLKPLFSTYMMILDQYAKRGDINNAEKMFHRMRQDGYVSRFRQYTSLLQAYINAKAPAYGFRERLKADNVFPSKSLAAQLAQVDAFKKTAVSDLLD
ncbi:Pentatricopeptide repeat-containing protein [Artemisia annua]|uniref:Pentatricopeptide repeat-containing protein n=1 Tax=Artemisia annua TaxID=35608 RepID=A0A2U1NEC8_ARTAN|nr:Pentatricopeptide repeat-containing protein [Artemisia annua]